MEITITTLPQSPAQRTLGAGGPTVVATLAGDLDGSTAPAAQDQVSAVASAGSTLILDMTRVPYMSSAGLRMLLLLHRRMTAQGGRVALVGVAEDVQDTMAVTGFLTFYTIYSTLEAALASTVASG